MNGDEELSRGVMGALCGVPIYESELATRPVVRETRVRGGYMNRWLLRAFVTVNEPTAYMMQRPPAGRPAIIAHPEVAMRLRGRLIQSEPRGAA